MKTEIVRLTTRRIGLRLKIGEARELLDVLLGSSNLTAAKLADLLGKRLEKLNE